MHVCLSLPVRLRTDVRARRVAATLADAGYVVSIIDFESDRRLPDTETLNNITVTHMKMPSLFVPARFKPWFLVKLTWMFVRAARQLLRMPADIYHASDLKALLPTYIAARLRRKPLIFESYELPLVEPKVRRWRRLHALAVRMIRLLIKRCDAVIVVSPPIVREVHHQYGGPMPTLLRNMPTYQPPLASNRLRERLGLPATTRIALYQGNISENRSLDVLVRAARYLPDNLVIILMGNGPSTERLAALIAHEEVGERVRLVPAVSYSELLAWTASADLGLIIYPPNSSPNVRYCLPNKLFEYLMAGLPVLDSPLDAVNDILETYGVGASVGTLDPEVVGRTIGQLLGDTQRLAEMRQRALAASAGDLRWEIEQTRLVSLYQSVVGANDDAPAGVSPDFAQPASTHSRGLL
jgi:glycosyltransferase involved in cell wall biosynthesis